MGTTIDNYQPSLALTEYIVPQGIFPSHSNGNLDPAQVTMAMLRMFAGNFVPGDNFGVNGQLLSIAQHTALFALVGTFYGGNGQTTFALPDLGGSAVIGTGQGPGLTDRVIGEETGSSGIALTQSQMPFPLGGNLPIDNQEPSLAITYLIDA